MRTISLSPKAPPHATRKAAAGRRAAGADNRGHKRRGRAGGRVWPGVGEVGWFGNLGCSIKSKAREWLGHLSAVVADGKTEAFKPHFFVGAPSDPRLNAAYEVAQKILSQAPNSPEVFEEAQLDEFVSQIEDEVGAHDAR